MGEPPTDPYVPIYPSDVRISGNLGLSINDDARSYDWLPSTERDSGAARLSDQIRRISNQPIDNNKLRILSLVNDGDTRRTLAAPEFDSRSIKGDFKSVAEFQEALRTNSRNFIIAIAHLEEGAKPLFGELPIDALKKSIAETGAAVLLLGCHSSKYFGSGADYNINSVEVANRLKTAMAKGTIGEFLEALSGPDLHLTVSTSLLNTLAHTLSFSVVDARGMPVFEVFMSGGSSFESSDLEPPSSLSLVCKALHVSYLC